MPRLFSSRLGVILAAILSTIVPRTWCSTPHDAHASKRDDNNNIQEYLLKASWQGPEFFESFEFYNTSDPTKGFVTYLDKAAAQNAGLVNIMPTGSVYLGVDHSTQLHEDGPGRSSVRLTSKKYYTNGLFIADFQHMPGSVCGSWPAFWTSGRNWPYGGELDIVEGVNDQDNDRLGAHTGKSVTLTESDGMTGEITAAQCGSHSSSSGCGVGAGDGSYGNAFNAANGGIYVLERTVDSVKVWFFPREAIPASILTGAASPDVKSFGPPFFASHGSDSLVHSLAPQQIIIDTTFCGDWAGSVFGKDNRCPLTDSSSPSKSCRSFVANNPAQFSESYWEINYIKFYELGTPPPPPPPLIPVIPVPVSAPPPPPPPAPPPSPPAVPSSTFSELPTSTTEPLPTATSNAATTVTSLPVTSSTLPPSARTTTGAFGVGYPPPGNSTLPAYSPTASSSVILPPTAASTTAATTSGTSISSAPPPPPSSSTSSETFSSITAPSSTFSQAPTSTSSSSSSTPTVLDVPYPTANAGSSCSYSSLSKKALVMAVVISWVV